MLLRTRTRDAALCAAGLFALALQAASCASSGDRAFDWRLPGTSREVTVSGVAALGGYIGADLRADDFSYRFLFPDAGICRGSIRPEARVRFANAGSLGRVEGPDGRCDPVGIASLREWIQRGHASNRLSKRQERVRYRVIHRDQGVAFLRGRFLLAGMVLRAPGAQDAVLVIADAPECRNVLESGQALLAFDRLGSTPLVLHSEGQTCEVRAYALPEPPDGWR